MEKKLLVLGMAAMMAAGAANAELQAFKVNGETVSARTPKARLNLTIEYLDVHDGASSLARSIMQRDRDLARALRDALNDQLQEEP